ncbi:MAG: AMP-binding protein, partial [Candidatus Pacearchaeota archaeon]|nr:AMP-binding protein [Candidatus Pacearchaeota archaeon]
MSKKLVEKQGIFFPSEEIKKESWIREEKIYEIADKDPIRFWEKLAKGIKWFKPWNKAYEEKTPFFKWFVGGKLNVCFNCIDRHLKKLKNNTAIIWVPEPTEKERKITYKELYEKTCKLANFLLRLGVKKGDVVAIYLPIIPE